MNRPGVRMLTLLALLASLLGGAIGSTPTFAATHIVTTAADSGAGSLRDTLASAAPGDTIVFLAALAGQTISLGSSLDLTRDVTIDGSALAARLAISGDSNNDGAGDVRVLSIADGVTATLNGLIIARGLADGPTSADNIGGAIRNSGTLTITNSLIAESAASADGGGIFNYTTLTVLNTTFSGNSAATNGGGIFTIGGTATIANSTFAGGAAQYGGGIATNPGAALAITNSTFSGNSASILGGGIYNGATLTITSTTLSGNSGSGGGGILNAGALSYANTIIANSAGGDCDSTLGTIVANTSNLVEDGSCSAALSGDPSLDTLDDNGGPTQTIALLPGSAAIDAGDSAACAAAPVNSLDQRGTPRPVGAQCDIGAYEFADISAPTVTIFTAPAISATRIFPITAFAASDNIAVSGYMITLSATPPPADGAGWSAAAPIAYTVASDGVYTLYPWARDAAGNVSAAFGAPATVSVDAAAPTVTTFAADTPSASLSILITAFTASDTAGVTGYLITQSPTPPAAGAAGWSSSAPVTYMVGGDGTYTLYPWAKDAAGNVSAAFGAPATVSVDASAPTVVSSARADPNPTTAASLHFLVTFSEPVSGVDAADFSLTTDGSISGAAISDVSGSGATYTVTITRGSGPGTIRLDVVDNDSIVDAAFNPLGRVGFGNGAFAAGEPYTIDLHLVHLPLVVLP